MTLSRSPYIIDRMFSHQNALTCTLHMHEAVELSCDTREAVTVLTLILFMMDFSLAVYLTLEEL